MHMDERLQAGWMEKYQTLRDQYEQVANERDYYERQYSLLANSKLGKLTLKYWKCKDCWKLRIKAFRKKLKLLPQLLKHRRRARLRLRDLLPQRIKRDRDLPSIGVIVPTYRPTAYFQECIGSILKQTYPAEKLRIYIAVNGDNRAYYEQLQKEYKDNATVTVIYTAKKGAAAGRNAALDSVKTDCITYVDDDDTLTPGFLRELGQRMCGDISIVCGRLVDYEDLSGSIRADTYVNRALAATGCGRRTDYALVGSLLSSLPAKLYRTELVRDRFSRLDEEVPNTEDVLFWAENYERLEGAFYACGSHGEEAYVRRLSPASLSRPQVEMRTKFYVDDRLLILKKLEWLLLNAETDEGKTFVLGKINAQSEMMHQHFLTLPEAEKEPVRKKILNCGLVFLNKSRFGAVRGIAFCHNFPPAADTAAYVASRRLFELSRMEDTLINWTVVCGNMSNCRETDSVYQKYMADYQYSKYIQVGGAAYFNEKAQRQWGRQAYAQIKAFPADIIYSRSMWAGSHVAAYLYKKNNPDVKWYAEFSDPLYMNSKGEKRPPTQLYSGEDRELDTFWRDVETAVYKYADSIIFTNGNQREYMLGYLADTELAGSVREKSVVLQHTTIDPAYCHVCRLAYPLDSREIHIGYFGSFYASRNADSFWKLLKNPRVRLHLFIAQSGDGQLSLPEEKDRIEIHKSLPYLEFLNVASRMDYLIVNDTTFAEPEKNPYLPSKVSDYLAADVPIIALVQSGSPLSKMEDPRILKTAEIDGTFVSSLKKKQENY